MEDILDTSLKKIAKGAGIGFVGGLIVMTLGYLSRMIIARFLGPSDYGLISLALATFSLVVTLSLSGFPTGITRYVSFYRAREDNGRVKGTIISALGILFPLNLIFAFLLFLSAGWISSNIFHVDRLKPILQIFSIAVPFWALKRTLVPSIIGFERLEYQVYVDILQDSIKLVLVVTLLFFGFGIFGVSCGYVIAFIASPFFAIYYLRRVFPPIFDIKSTPMYRKLISYSLPLTFAGMASMVLGWTDTFMLGFFKSAYDVGIYNAALPIAQLMRVPLTSLGSLFVPVVTGLYSQGKFENLRDVYTTVTKWVFLLVLPAFLLMMFFAKSILQILFGDEYIVGSSALRILAIGFLFNVLFGFSRGVINVYGRTKLNMISVFIAAGSNFILNLYLIPLYGVNGAATATAISFIIMGVIWFFFGYQIARLKPFKLKTLKFIPISIVSILLIYTVTKLFFEPTFYILIAMFFVFLVIYFFLLLVFKCFDQEDLMIMKAIDQRLGTKSDLLRKIIRRFL